jgi:hypothetical protein
MDGQDWRDWLPISGHGATFVAAKKGDLPGIRGVVRGRPEGGDAGLFSLRVREDASEHGGAESPWSIPGRHGLAVFDMTVWISMSIPTTPPLGSIGGWVLGGSAKLATPIPSRIAALSLFSHRIFLDPVGGSPVR